MSWQPRATLWIWLDTHPGTIGINFIVKKQEAIIDALFLGQIQTLWPDRPPSAIVKHATESPVWLTSTGFDGDAQADLKVHGGVEKAVHHYAADHYPDWTTSLGPNPTFRPGGFGENLSTTGLTEQQLCIGDVFSLGEAKVQISQGRQPCWKLNLHTGIKQMALLFQETARTGWYYRVLEPGMVQAGDRITLLERLHPQWNMERVIRARLDPKVDVKVAKELSQLPELAEGWRLAFEKKASKGFSEDVSKRLGT